MRGGDLWAAREPQPEPLERSLGALLDADDAAVVVGTVEGVVVGYGVVVVEELRDGRRVGVVTDLFVEPAARKVGVGEAVVGDLLSFSRAAGCVGVDGMALPGHRQAKTFFEGAGFQARAIVMHRPLR